MRTLLEYTEDIIYALLIIGGGVATVILMMIEGM